MENNDFEVDLGTFELPEGQPQVKPAESEEEAGKGPDLPEWANETYSGPRVTESDVNANAPSEFDSITTQYNVQTTGDINVNSELSKLGLDPNDFDPNDFQKGVNNERTFQ